VGSLNRSIVPVLLLLFGVAGCRDTSPMELIRSATYPPDFNYVTGQQLRDSMDRLGYNLQRLDEVLIPNEGGQQVPQREVVSVLGDIERIATNLRAGDAGSNHPFLEDHMSDFAVQVGRARLAAMSNPPNYYLAGQVAGGCVNCHRINRDPQR